MTFYYFVIISSIIFAVLSVILSCLKRTAVKENVCEDYDGDDDEKRAVRWGFSASITADISVAALLSFVCIFMRRLCVDFFERSGYVYDDYSPWVVSLIVAYLVSLSIKLMYDINADLPVFLAAGIVIALLALIRFGRCEEEEFENLPYEKTEEIINIQPFPGNLAQKHMDSTDGYVVFTRGTKITLYYMPEQETILEEDKVPHENIRFVYEHGSYYIRKTIYTRSLVKDGKVVKSEEDTYYEIHVGSEDDISCFESLEGMSVEDKNAEKRK